jgi:hypothetical protein
MTPVSANPASDVDAVADLAALSCEHFAPLLGQAFTLSVLPPEGEAVLLVALVEAKVLPHPPFNGRQGFALIFTGPAQPRWPQGTYRLSHGAWHTGFDVFIVPVAADAQGVSYQSIFN